MGFLRQAAKPQHSALLPAISSIWKTKSDWKCSQDQKLKCGFIWVSQLCNDPGLPPTRNDNLHQSLLCFSAPASHFSCRCYRGCRMHAAAWPPSCSCQAPHPTKKSILYCFAGAALLLFRCLQPSYASILSEYFWLCGLCGPINN